jgi:hypothetical protein
MCANSSKALAPAFEQNLISFARPLLCREMCVVFIDAVPNTQLCAWVEEDSGGHVL